MGRLDGKAAIVTGAGQALAAVAVMKRKLAAGAIPGGSANGLWNGNKVARFLSSGDECGAGSGKLMEACRKGPA